MSRVDTQGPEAEMPCRLRQESKDCGLQFYLHNDELASPDFAPTASDPSRAGAGGCMGLGLFAAGDDAWQRLRAFR